MVALIKTIKSLSGSFYYNERKLGSGDAICLMAENYPRQLSELSQSDRLGMLEKMAALNPRTKVNGLHIFLNFDPSNKLSSGSLQEIARFYMHGIGFGNQPYLVYAHLDAAHPHLHILTTNIRADGRRINLYMKTAHFQSLLKQIRTRFALTTSRAAKDLPARWYPAQLSRLIYGKSQTFGGIAHVLEAVLREYRFTSFAELNAILGLYNVRAERGKQGSKLFKNKGLIYGLLDGSGNRVGVPVKASSLPFNPGLTMLEERFKRNVPLKRGLEGRIQREIDLVLNKAEICDSATFCASLKTKGINVILKGESNGTLQELMYVDHHRKCVFSGADLGRTYDSQGIFRGLSANRKSINRQEVDNAFEFEKLQGHNAEGLSDGLISDDLPLVPPEQHLPSILIVKTKRRAPRRKQNIKH